MDTVYSTPEGSQLLLSWTVLFISIYTAYLRESEVAEYFPAIHCPRNPTAVNLIIISYHRQTGVCDSANWFGPIDIGWRIEGSVKFGHYVEGIHVGVLTFVRLFVCPAILFFRFLLSAFRDFARLHNL